MIEGLLIILAIELLYIIGLNRTICRNQVQQGKAILAIYKLVNTITKEDSNA